MQTSMHTIKSSKNDMELSVTNVIIWIRRANTTPESNLFDRKKDNAHISRHSMINKYMHSACHLTSSKHTFPLSMQTNVLVDYL